MSSHHRLFLSAAAVVFAALMTAPAPAGEWPPDYLRKPALRVVDASGALRWQVPVMLWYYPNKELGGFAYPVGASPDKPLSVKGDFVFVGYGLTREGWDDYQKQRIDGSIAVMFTGTPQMKPPADRMEPTDVQEWTRLIHEKVANAQAHGAVGVWMESNPLAPADESGISFHPRRTASLWGGMVMEQLPLPVFSVGVDTLGVIVGFSSDLFGGHMTPGGEALRYLLKEAESEGKGLGPVPLALAGELWWSGAQLEKSDGTRCTIWYQPASPAARDIDALLKAYDSTLGDLESVLSARVEGRTTVLLFGDWRSKLFTTHHIGWGAAQAGRVACVYEGSSEEKGTLVHELCHIVAGQLGGPPACFVEGLGELAGTTLGDLQSVQRGRVSADDVTAANLRDGKLWTLTQLLALPDIGSSNSNPTVAYPEAASFCAFLMRQIGFDGFRKLYQTLKPGNPQQIVSEIERAAGRTLDQLERDWHAYLRGIAR
jgi:hypothetical protein